MQWVMDARAAELDVGDRFQLFLVHENGEQSTYRVTFPELHIEELVDCDSGMSVPFDYDPVNGLLRVRAAAGPPGARPGPVWLEYLGGARFALTGERWLRPAEEESLELSRFGTLDEAAAVDAIPAADAATLERLLRPAGDPELFWLAQQAVLFAGQGGFHRLLCLASVRELDILEHQIRTVRTVLNRFRGRALLCDEVGLGKTIEAGLVISELLVRRLARSVLVLTPPSLVEQWQGEMRRKFTLDFVTHDQGSFRSLGRDAWLKFDRIIASTHTAKRDPHRNAIASRQWDILVVDEAHHLRNRNTVLWRFVSQIRKQFVLLLTATPVQNSLDELYNLVTLLEPGLLSTAKQFQRLFMDRRDRLSPRNIDRLHELLREVMVRNRRSSVDIRFTRRIAQTFHVQPDAEERDLYGDVSGFVHSRLATPDRRWNRNVLLTLQMALGSSPVAAGRTLRRLAERSASRSEEAGLLELADRAERLGGGAKLRELLKLLEQFSEKLVIFTHFRATLDELETALLEAGHDVAVFHGGMPRLAKEEAVERFRTSARLLLSTDAGSEGRNLQFAHGICNYDLPWNPMRIEQRIGRLSRIGQHHDVYVFNLVADQTIEWAILHLLEVKLHMFELVIGEIDMILGNVEEDKEFQELVFEIWRTSRDFADFQRRMERLGERLVQAKQEYVKQRQIEERLFGDAFAPDP